MSQLLKEINLSDERKFTIKLMSLEAGDHCGEASTSQRNSKQGFQQVKVWLAFVFRAVNRLVWLARQPRSP